MKTEVALALQVQTNFNLFDGFTLICYNKVILIEKYDFIHFMKGDKVYGKKFIRTTCKG